MTFGTLVGKMSVVSTFEACDFVQVLESSWWSVCAPTRVHSVVGLGVGHEGLAQLVVLLLPQLRGHLEAVTDLVTNLSTIMTCDDHFLS